MNLDQHVFELAQRLNVRLDIRPGMDPHQAGSGFVAVMCPACGRTNRIRRTGAARCGACKTSLGVQHTAFSIVIAPVTDEATYAIALHELGHSMHPTGRVNDSHGSRTMRALNQLGTLDDMRYQLLEEQSAWEWAEANAITWTPAMAALKREALSTYERTARQLGLRPDGKVAWRTR